MCQNTLSPPCTLVHPLCNDGDTGFTADDAGSADVAAGSNPCGAGSTPVQGRNVPPECTYAFFGPGSADGACGGSYGMRPGRLAAIPGVGGDSGGSFTSRLFCQAAHFIPGSGSPCDPQTEMMRVTRSEQLALEAGWTRGMGTHEQCDPPGKRGIRRCIVCDDTTGCHETIDVPPYNPAIAEDNEDAPIFSEFPKLVPAVEPPPKHSPKQPPPTFPATSAAEIRELHALPQGRYERLEIIMVAAEIGEQLNSAIISARNSAAQKGANALVVLQDTEFPQRIGKRRLWVRRITYLAIHRR